MIDSFSYPQILIYIHASFGGIALLFGAIALISKKGQRVHKLTGKIFFYTMLASALTALIISIIPEHENAFLFTIGVFSSYFLLTGYLALRYRRQELNLRFDYCISILMIVTGIGMIAYPIILTQKINIILTAFGLTGLIFAIQDLRLYKNREKLKSNWLKAHLGKMIGGYIAAVTAFVVVNNVVPPLFAWLGPGLIGGFYIAYWSRKVNNQQSEKAR